ncbi:MAG: hypothetical protein LH660_16390 [Phormidesmis sp. CAN_BIN36]|nr:hypothetical protein [Phormidesmis sp. CAN_BIN36]
MALDIHAGKSKNVASQRKRWAFFDEHVHASLIGRISRVSLTNSRDIIVLRFPLLNRLHDFYKDCSYDLSEIGQLVEEVWEIKQEFINDQRIVTQLEIFEKACRDARNGDLNLYIFAD